MNLAIRLVPCCILPLLRAAVLLLSLAPASAMAQQFVYSYDQRLPSNYDDVFNLPSIGVIPLRGVDGQNFSAAMAGELQAIRIGNRPAFSIRTEDSGAAPGKTRKSPPDTVYARTAADRLGVKGLLWGTITSAAVTTDKYIGAATSCQNKVCTEVPIDCFKYQGSYTVTPVIYAADTGKILYQRQIKRDSVTDVCGGMVRSSSLGDIFGGLFGKKKEQQALTPDSIMTAIRLDAVRSVIADLTPKTRKAKVGFKTKFPEFDKDGQTRLALAIDQLKSGRPDKACGMFEQMGGEGAATKQLSLRYNLAACEEVNGNFNVAKQIYQAYDRDHPAVDQMLNDALKRLSDVK
ncbi:hypothetical protein [Novosphingobium sp.]|uniref:hypothetical protein n=1 Tax=Novosphingobium sp. TaxID=1874826 RepID=UPI003BAA2B02